MFTGLVQGIGRIVEVEPLAADGGVRLVVDARDVPDFRAEVGDSIALNGACMTATRVEGSRFAVDVSRESLSKTAGLDRPSEVNIETSLRLGAQLGGHLVAGHVDGIGEVLRFAQQHESWELIVRAPPSSRSTSRTGFGRGQRGQPQCVHDTPAGCDFDQHHPAYLRVTTLQSLQASSRINLEAASRGVRRVVAAGGRVCYRERWAFVTGGRLRVCASRLAREPGKRLRRGRSRAPGHRDLLVATAIVPPERAGLAALAAGAAVLLAVQPLIALGLVDRAEIGLTPPRAGSTMAALIAIALAVAVNILVMTQREPLPLRVTDYALLLIAAPLVEEFVFRGVLLALVDRASPPRWNILGARIGAGGVLLTLAFVALHGLRPGMLLGIMPAAFIYLWLRARTGSLLWPLAGHVAWNLAVIMVHRP
jgi:riboflavin synthase